MILTILSYFLFIITLLYVAYIALKSEEFTDTDIGLLTFGVLMLILCWIMRLCFIVED